MKIQPAFLMALAAVVLSSACIGTQAASYGNGVKITGLKFVPQSIDDGKTAFLQLAIQNTGTFDIPYDKNAGSAIVNVFGLTAPYAINTYDPDTKSITETASLRAPNPALYPQGQTKAFEWQYKPSLGIPLDESITEKASVRVCYPYKTETRARVDFISSDEYLVQQSKGGINENSIAYQETHGPISLSIDSRQPIIYENGEANTIRIKLKVTNAGGGFAVGACSDTGGLEGTSKAAGSTGSALSQLNKVSLNVYEKKPDGSNADVCDIVLSKSREQFLKKGEARDVNLVCSFAGLSGPRETRDLALVLTYSYYEDVSANLEIKGVKTI